MAYTRQYRTILPLQKTDDLDVALWLTRESFDRRAASEFLQIIEFSHRPIDPDTLPPKAAKQLGRPLTDFVWIEYSGTAQRAQGV